MLGKSLGGAVALHVAAANPERVAAVIVENTFLSIEDVAPKACALPMLLYCKRHTLHTASTGLLHSGSVHSSTASQLHMLCMPCRAIGVVYCAKSYLGQSSAGLWGCLLYYQQTQSFLLGGGHEG